MSIRFRSDADQYSELKPITPTAVVRNADRHGIGAIRRERDGAERRAQPVAVLAALRRSVAALVLFGPIPSGMILV